MKIHKACDYISLDWLLYGEGQMETDVDSDNNIHYTPSLFDENSLFNRTSGFSGISQGK